jgi:hypothetical protein
MRAEPVLDVAEAAQAWREACRKGVARRASRAW